MFSEYSPDRFEADTDTVGIPFLSYRRHDVTVAGGEVTSMEATDGYMLIPLFCERPAGDSEMRFFEPVEDGGGPGGSALWFSTATSDTFKALYQELSRLGAVEDGFSDLTWNRISIENELADTSIDVDLMCIEVPVGTEA